MNSYCVRCRGKTPTQNVKYTQTKNGRHLLKGTCAVCGSKKSQFISAKQGKGLIGKALGIGKVPILGDLPLIGGLF